MSNIYKESIKALKKIMKYNKMISAQEWDKHASNNNLMSSTTLKAKEDVDTFQQVKEMHKWF